MKTQSVTSGKREKIKEPSKKTRAAQKQLHKLAIGFKRTHKRGQLRQMIFSLTLEAVRPRHTLAVEIKTTKKSRFKQSSISCWRRLHDLAGWPWHFQ